MAHQKTMLLTTLVLLRTSPRDLGAVVGGVMVEGAG
jgi:hypothetical protein